jgi:carbon storage regulator
MLIFSRRKDEKFVIGDDVEITILEIHGNRIRFGIKAPKHIQVHTRLKTSAVPLPDKADNFDEQTVSLQDFSSILGMSKRV